MALRGGTYDEWYDKLVGVLGWDGKTDTDWIDAVTRTGYFQEYNISFNGTSGNGSTMPLSAM